MSPEVIPTPERLMDAASALDSAILERQPHRAAAAADRLVVDLLRRERHLERMAPRVDRSAAERLAEAHLALRAGVLLLAAKLRAGEHPPRANVCRRVQALIHAEAVSVGQGAGPPGH